MRSVSVLFDIKTDDYEFKQTDLPEPVAPATNKWGMLAIFAVQTLPLTSLPSGISRFDLRCIKASDSSVSRMRTMAGLVFGTSIPTKDLPGIGASILTGWAAKARARSLFRP